MGDEMNLRKLAKLANVSVSTVSKALSDSGEISLTTKEKIIQLAKENDCYEKYYKGKYNKKIIAVICPEMKSEYYNRMLVTLEETISKNGGLMLLSVSGFNPQTEMDLFTYYSTFQHADGILVIGSGVNIPTNTDSPIVLLGGSQKKDIDCIGIDSYDAIEEAVRYLKENGHRDIGFIGEALTRQRQERFLSAMKKHSLTVKDTFIITSDGRFEDAGFKSMENLIAKGTLPTAILAAYDYIALGAMHSMKLHGLKIPNDISVIGMDDISVLSYLDTPLTSIHTPIDDMCEIAVELLLKKIDNRYFRARQSITVKCRLVQRESVKNLLGDNT